MAVAGAVAGAASAAAAAAASVDDILFDSGWPSIAEVVVGDQRKRSVRDTRGRGGKSRRIR